LQKPPVVQSWWRGFSSSTGRSNNWNTRDEKGLLRVLSAETDVESPDPEGLAVAQYVTPWTWNGQKFVEEKTTPKRYRDLDDWHGPRDAAEAQQTR